MLFRLNQEVVQFSKEKKNSLIDALEKFKVSIVETYKKEYTLTTTGNKLYKDVVHCEKYCNTTTSAKHYKKVQVFFEAPKQWKEQIF